MRNAITIVATALIALAASTTAAQAASSSAKCKKAAKPGKVIAKGPKSLVFELTHAPKVLEDYFYGCHYKTGKAYRLPSQDGGDTLHPGHYVFKGDLLAYTVLDNEPAGASAYEDVLLVNLRKRKRLAKAPAFSPPANDPDVNFGASSAPSLIVDTRGYVAWIGRYRRKNKTSYNVQVAGAAVKAQVLDTGDGIASKSLRRSKDRATLRWKKDGAARSALFPPPPAAGLHAVFRPARKRPDKHDSPRREGLSAVDGQREARGAQPRDWLFRSSRRSRWTRSSWLCREPCR